MDWGSLRSDAWNVQKVETTLYSLSDAPPAAPAERRDGDRLMTLYRVGSLSIGERRELCLIKNICAGGMMVRAYCAIPEGTRADGRTQVRPADLRHGQLGARRPCRDQLRRADRRHRNPVDLDGRPAPAHAADRGRMLRHAARRRVDLSRAAVRHQPGRAEDRLRDRASTLGSRRRRDAPRDRRRSRRWCAGSTATTWASRSTACSPLPTLVEWLREQRDSLRAASATPRRSTLDQSPTVGTGPTAIQVSASVRSCSVSARLAEPGAAEIVGSCAGAAPGHD